MGDSPAASFCEIRTVRNSRKLPARNKPRKHQQDRKPLTSTFYGRARVPRRAGLLAVGGRKAWIRLRDSRVGRYMCFFDLNRPGRLAETSARPDAIDHLEIDRPSEHGESLISGIVGVSSSLFLPSTSDGRAWGYGIDMSDAIDYSPNRGGGPEFSDPQTPTAATHNRPHEAILTEI